MGIDPVRVVFGPVLARRAYVLDRPTRGRTHLAQVSLERRLFIVHGGQSDVSLTCMFPFQRMVATCVERCRFEFYR